eukprot:GGOE01018475.1.p1 GENE.GGOE01018475.1~~GGOE01018475.1.p1  ORF type:complete len:1161 (-),score=460.16 GGOE01018475.1:68-3310(-)
MPKPSRDYLDVTPPTVVAVVGPPGCGKTTLIRSLVKHYTRQTLRNVKGPVTVVAGRARRITFLECTQDLNVMCDVARVADLVLLLIDASFGFEMETFEFLNIAQSHGFPKVIGCLTYLDKFRKNKALKRQKKILKHRFWKEVCAGAKLFFLSGMDGGYYLPREMLNLARFIGVSALKPQNWRTTHPAILVDRVEDLTPPVEVEKDPLCPRTVCMYGFIRGKALRPTQKVHIPGIGDFSIADISVLEDPCPLPSKALVKNRQRHLTERMRRLYAPMSDIGDLLYDQHNVYLAVDRSVERVGKGMDMLHQLASDRFHVDEGLRQSGISLLAQGEQLQADEGAVEAGFEDLDLEDDGRRPSLNDGEDDDDDNDDDDDGMEDDGDDPGFEVSDVRPDGTKRRRAVFSDEEAAREAERAKGEDEEEDDDDNEDDDEAEGPKGGQLLPASWNPPKAGQHAALDLEDEELEENEGMGPLFTKVAGDILNSDDITRERPAQLSAWEREDVREVLRNLFVTGKWTVEESAKEGGGAAPFEMLDENANDDEGGEDAQPMGEEEEEEEEDGDMREGLEQLGNDELRQKVQYWKEKQQSKNPTEMQEAPPEEDKAEEDEDMAEYRKKKVQAKKAFDQNYDSMNNLQQMKHDLQEQNSKMKEVMDQLPAIEERVKVFGYYEGLYLRIVLEKMPAEFLKEFDPRRPVVMGGLLPHEEKLGMVYMRIKKHRWYPRILKCNDPLVLSIGWRRFQTMPVYAIEDQNGRHRYLKYTPLHMHCIAVFWGPIFPPNTGVICFQNVMDKTAKHFRPAATGYIMQSEKSSCVVKKIRLTGVPVRIHKNTCFIKNMFNSPLEVAKFEGAKLKTVSGIRGAVKKAVPNKNGIFRAVFEDKILMADIVNLRTWKAVAPEQYYNPVTDLLKGAGWRAMRTQNELRRLHGIPIPKKGDSSYRAGPARRAEKTFNPLVVPDSMVAKLPFQRKKRLTKVVKSSLQKTRMELALQAATARVYSPEETARSRLVAAVQKEAKRRARKQGPSSGKLLKQKLVKKVSEAKKRKRDSEQKMRKKQRLARDSQVKAGEGLRKHNASKRKATRKKS